MALIGLAVGIVSGGLQFLLLKNFTKRITGGSLTIRAILLGLLQFLLPLAVLVAIAFLRRQDLLLTGIGIIVALIAGAVVKYIVNARKKGESGDNNA